MTISLPPISYPAKPRAPFTGTPPQNLFPDRFPMEWKNITGKPYITVSSKGLANGQSEYINDGADFGPDSLQADGTLTRTSGIQEAVVFAFTSSFPGKKIVKILAGNFNVYQSITISGNGLGITIEGAGEMVTFITQYFSGTLFVVKNVDDSVFSITMGHFQSEIGSGIPTYIIDVQNGAALIFTNIVQGESTGMSSTGAVFNIASSVYYVAINNCANYDGGCSMVNYTGTWTFSNQGSGSTISIINGTNYGSLHLSNCEKVIIENMNYNCTSTLFYLGICGIVSINDTEFQGIVLTDNINFLEINGTVSQIGDAASNYITTSPSTSTFNLYRFVLKNGLMNPNTSGQDLFSSTVTYSDIEIQNIFSNDGYDYTLPVLTPTLTANPPVSATVYQNTNPYDIEIDLPVYATTAGTAGYVTIAKGATSTPTAIGNQFVNGSTSSTSTEIIKLRVPAGWYYEFTESGVTFGTASVFAE